MVLLACAAPALAYTDFMCGGSAPDRPTNSSPASGATVSGPAVTLSAGPYSDFDGDPHAASQWQVRSGSGTWTSPAADSGESTTSLTSWTTPALAGGTYWFRVRYRDVTGMWSTFSPETSFTIPTGSSPSRGVTLSLAVTSATTLDPSGCASGASGITRFGNVLPGGSVVTTADCSVSWGSSNDTAQLYMTQADGFGAPLVQVPHAWNDQSSGTTVALAGVAAGSGERAWAVGSGGTIRTTADGGSSWTAQASGTSSALTQAHAADDQRAWVVGASGTILRTIDAGATWSPQDSGAGTTALRDIDGSSADRLLVVGDGGLILRSTNGGAAWATRASQTTNALLAVTMVGDQAFAVGASGTIRASTDGGLSWTAQASPISATITDVACASGLRCWIAGQDGSIARTTDAGATWVAQASGTSSEVSSLAVLDADTAWAVGAAGYLSRTTDGGSTWVRVTTSSAASIRSISRVAADHRAWMAGDGGVIRRTAPATVASYVAGASDWTTGASMFGSCLRAVSGASVSANWSLNATCPASNGTYWYALATSTAAPGSRVASTTSVGVADATAAFRFGLRTAASQPSGQYRAQVAFQVVAPGV